jgi:hypothetical protein
MNIEKEILEKILSDIDLTKYKKQINNAVDRYLNSESFIDSVAESMKDGELPWEVGEIVAKKIKQQLKNKIKIEFN